MRIVLYDDDMEPLTILELPHWRQLGMPPGCIINVPLPRKVDAVMWRAGASVPTEPERGYVSIRFEQLMRKGELHWLAIADDAEGSLRLRAAFLPGQNAEVQRRERDAFFHGLLALTR